MECRTCGATRGAVAARGERRCPRGACGRRTVLRHHALTTPRPPTADTGVEEQVQEGFATALVAKVAALIPVPDENLGADAASWAAFDVLVEEAALLLANAFGPQVAQAVHTLGTAPVGAEPIGDLLRERTLELLTVRPGH